MTTVCVLTAMKSDKLDDAAANLKEHPCLNTKSKAIPITGRGGL
jgi:hypothetical protein